MSAGRVAVGLIVAAWLAGCGTSPAAGSATPTVGPRVGEVAPPLSGTSLQGHRISLAAWRGSVVVVVFWASWCVPCQAEQPAVNAVAAQAAAGVRFAGISVDATRPAAQAYLTHYSVPYDSLIDSSDDIVRSYEVVGPPTTFVIDRKGRVAAQLVGQLNTDDLRSRITAALSAQ